MSSNRPGQLRDSSCRGTIAKSKRKYQRGIIPSSFTKHRLLQLSILLIFWEVRRKTNTPPLSFHPKLNILIFKKSWADFDTVSCLYWAFSAICPSCNDENYIYCAFSAPSKQSKICFQYHFLQPVKYPFLATFLLGSSKETVTFETLSQQGDRNGKF